MNLWLPLPLWGQHKQVSAEGKQASARPNPWNTDFLMFRTDTAHEQTGKHHKSAKTPPKQLCSFFVFSSPSLFT